MKHQSLFILVASTLLAFPGLTYGQAPNLGTASGFALFTASGALTNSGASVVTGDIGTNVGLLTGFPMPGTIVGNTRLPGSSQAAQAAIDVVSAYNSLTSTACATAILPELGGQTLTSGVYCQSTASPTSLTGTLTLSGPGVFIIKLNSALTTATSSSIVLTNGASADKVFFQVNGAVTLGTGSSFRGTILALDAIGLNPQASLEGRALSTAGAIALTNNIVTNSALSLSVLVDPCDPATNQYSISGTISLTNAVVGTATLSDGAFTTTVSITDGDTSVPYSLPGLTSATASHTLLVSYASYSASTTYTAPASCSVTIPVIPVLELEKLVNRSTANVGDTLTYRLVLTNTGSVSATTTIRDSLSSGSTFLIGSIVVPPGTTFTFGTPGLWTVPSIAAGQSLTLSFQVVVDSTGILYNTASLPSDTVKVCTSVPIKMCPGDSFTLRVPFGRAAYHWYRDGVLIQDQTTNVLTVTQPGTYSLGVDNVGSSCPDFSCCPAIFVLDSLPVFQAIATPASCVGNMPQANGKLVISGFKPTHTYQYSVGASYDPAASLSGPPQVIPVGGVLTSNLVSPLSATMYTVRVYNSSGCYTDQTVVLLPTVCGCPAEVCVPYVISQTKRTLRIGDPR